MVETKTTMITSLQEHIFKVLLLSDQLELTYAARYDQFNILDEGGFSPRVALVYKMNEKNTFRATYNIATAPPSALQTFIDFPVNVIVPNQYDVWLSGQVDDQGFAANAPISLGFLGGQTIPQGSTSIPNAVLAGAFLVDPSAPDGLGANNATVQATIASFLAGTPAAGLTPIVNGALSDLPTIGRILSNLGASSSGQLGIPVVQDGALTGLQHWCRI